MHSRIVNATAHVEARGINCTVLERSLKIPVTAIALFRRIDEETLMLMRESSTCEDRELDGALLVENGIRRELWRAALKI